MHDVTHMLGGYMNPEVACLCVPLIWLSVTDLRARRIPNACVLLVMGIHATSCLLRRNVWALAAGALWASGLLLALVALSSLLGRHARTGPLGGGDIKLMAAMAFCLGPRRLALALMMASALGIVTWLVLRWRGQARADHTFPWGPALSISLMVALATS